MTDKNALKDRARDELFSHINRCGVLEAAHDDQEQWLNETMDYLAERYPDLGESELGELYRLGLAFCRPVIRHGNDSRDGALSENGAPSENGGPSENGAPSEAAVGAGAEDENAS